ncbi:Mur ligase family protein, partial [Conexibacter sp. JD483]|uniref:Mur ligase family protein n=1 Tax=Conexibacter sp. JD483 TaxID=3064471 RepID=UPI0028701186
MRFSELDGKVVGVWGAGREISSFARQLANRLPRARIAVVAADARADGSVDAGVSALAESVGARVVVGAAEAVEALRACDAVVRSPGVSIHRPELFALRAGGTPVTTATSLWLAERGGRGVIGVTGTKGKSTTAALIAHLARAAGVATDLAGNIGVPALDLLDAPPAELAVIELSSYQIADLATGTEVAIVTNLYREHVDWHGSEEAYQADKLRLLTLPGVRVAVVGDTGASEAAGEAARIAGDARAATVARGAGVELAPFGGPGGWHVTGDGVARGEARAADGAASAGCGEVAIPTAALPVRG